MTTLRLAAILLLSLVLCPQAARAQGLNAAQSLALNSIPPALAASVTAARNALVAASLAVPADAALLARRASELAQAELAVAMGRADMLARLQASPNRLTPAQLAQTLQSVAGGGRGGGAGAPVVVPFADAPKVPLWPNGSPGALGDADADKPVLAVYLAPKRADGQPRPAVVMAPGGGYARVSTSGGEGDATAEWFNSLGVSAFILRYRVAPYRYPAETDDGRRAMRLVRSRAAEFGIDPNRIGIMGYSAGGHLAAYTSTVFDAGDPSSADPIERASSRPDFAMLFYPVISFNTAVAGQQNLTAYASSGLNLLGANPSAELLEQLSVDTRVTANNPPTFLYHGTADTAVTSENSLRFYLALKKAGVPVELHTFESGGHATGISAGDPLRGTLPELIKTWLRVRGVVSLEIP